MAPSKSDDVTISNGTKMPISMVFACVGMLVASLAALGLIQKEQGAHGVKIDALIKAFDEHRNDMRRFDDRLRAVEARRE
jgi:hypothetical protein